MEIRYNPNDKTYSVGESTFSHESLVTWVRSGGLAKTLLSDKVYLITEKSDPQEDKLPYRNFSLQQIYYGAPGTGKSHKIKDITEKYPEDNTIRTTFHPDSDYATFVGCYKPSMKIVKQTYIVEGEQKPVLDAQTREQVSKPEIVYDYTPQAFTQAYVRAWKSPDAPVFLIIEEINRGNCAQIFGDLFQLLDRNENGESEYPIHSDKDLQHYLAQEFENCDIDNENIKNGSILKLPGNLYIWATMNTSDQSLFPIDSAFKRRWNWEYIPIKDEEKGYEIKAGEQTFDWWQFLQAVNTKIYEATQSEDKQMGYFFVKPNGTEITKDIFVNKVVFYLWNDVFKDYPCEEIFPQGHKFHDFFNPEHGNTKTEEVIEFIERILSTTAE